MNTNELEIDLLGFLMKANDPATHRALQERLPRDPGLAAQANRLRRLLEPLERSRVEIEPPADLALKTIGFVAAHMAEKEVARIESEAASRNHTSDGARGFAAAPVFPSHYGSGAFSSVQRRNWFAAIGLAAALMVVALPAISAVRAQHRVQVCQNNLREMHGALSTYAELHAKQFPLMESRLADTRVIDQLHSAGLLPATYTGICRPGDSAFDYAYAIGFMADGQVTALRQDEPENLPLMADACEADLDTPRNHRHGQNVLYIDGSVQFCRTPHVGVNRDHIYCNWNREVKPGLNRLDSVLAASDEIR